MTDLELRKIAHYIIMEATSNDELLSKVAKMIKSSKPEKRLVPAKRAAEMLGISVWQLYKIKDDDEGRPRFSYVKTGNTKSSTLKFNAATLMSEYERYLAAK